MPLAANDANVQWSLFERSGNCAYPGGRASSAQQHNVDVNVGRVVGYRIDAAALHEPRDADLGC